MALDAALLQEIIATCLASWLLETFAHATQIDSAMICLIT